MTFRILPYKAGSASVKKLKEELNALVIKKENSRYRYRDGHTVINWGCSTLPPSLQGVDVINPAEAVALSVNKLTALEELDSAGVSTVPFTTDVDEASQWLEEGGKVFVRNELKGHSGEGIVVEELQRSEEERELLDRLLNAGYHDAHAALLDAVPAGVQLPDAPLYTKGVSNKGEYRVHVFDGEVILYQKKSRRVDEDGEVVTAEGEEADVRNLASNWIYRTGNLNRLERVEELALDAIDALGLDFGAVDIINDNDSEVYVLEVNTAVGIGNEATLEAYTEAFKGLE